MSKKQIEIWQDPAKEIAELLLDEALEKAAPGLAKVPLLSTFMAAIKSGHAWGDYILARKVQQFYEGWEQLPKAERKAIYEKFQKKPRQFTEKLLFILDKQEDGHKCRVIGRLTARYLQGNLRRAHYYDLIETTTHLTITDLQKFATLLSHQSVILPEHTLTQRWANNFIARGLVVNAPRLPREQREGSARHYQLTKLGHYLAEAM